MNPKPNVRALKQATMSLVIGLLTSPLIATTTSQASEGLRVVPTDRGAELVCVVQRITGEAKNDGLWLASTATGQAADRFQVKAIGLGWVGSAGSPSSIGGGRGLPRLTSLPADGRVSVDGQIVRFSRPRLVEEYSVSVDGVRQDFVVLEKPAGENGKELRLELAVKGAGVESTAAGAQLVLEKSGRKIAYSRLKVTDAIGRELQAHMVVAAADTTAALTVVVDDTAAVYPVRIDPTYSDAHWVSLGGLPGANDSVSAAAVDADGNLYIGGTFTAAGEVPARHIAKWNGTNWSTLGGGLDGPVYALAVFEGNVYAGGSFFTASNSGGAVVPVNSVAKWDGNAWTALGAGMNNTVTALAATSGEVYAGGDFTTADGLPANRVAKWNGSNWSALGTGMNFKVAALAVAGGSLIAGGSFTNAGGTSARYIAQWNGVGWSSLGSGMNQPVYALAVSGSDVFAGGAFTSAGGTAANCIARWDGVSWNVLGSGISLEVRALAVSGGDLYAGGWFYYAGGVPANSIAKWDGSNWSALGTGVGGSLPIIYAVAASGTNVYAGGLLTSAGDTPAKYVARWNSSAWNTMGAGLDSTVLAMAVSGDELIVGGQFTTAGGVAAKHVAKWSGNAWSALGSGFDGDVWTLAVAGSNVYAGGYFKTAGGSPASCIAKWDGSSWSALGGGVDGDVFALTVSGSNLFAGGSFTYATNSGGVAVVANGIVRWNGSTWVPLGLGMNNWVQTLASSGNDLYAGGLFTTAGGNPASRIAKWDGTNWSAIGGLNSSVYSLASSGNILYAGGAFTRVTNGAGVSIAASRIAAWDGTNWSALGSGLDNTVNALVFNTGKLYVGGIFSTAGGSPALRICEWNGAAWSPLGAGTDGVSPNVRSLAGKGTDIYVGGWFTTAGGKISGHAAKWAPLAFQTGSINVSNGLFNVILTGPDTNSVIVEAASNLTDWTPIATNTLPVGGRWQTAIPVGTNIHQSLRARLGP